MIYKLIISGIIFIGTIGSGVWLSKLGKPYGTLIFNVHKFVALGFIVYSFVVIKNLIKTIDTTTAMWFLILLSGVLILTLLATGGIVSASQEIKKALVVVHKISSILLLISLSGWYFLSLK